MSKLDVNVDPLGVDKEIVKELKVPEEAELHPRQKLAFLEEQLHQLKAMHFRSRVDVLHARRLQKSDNKVLQNKGFNNESEHQNAVEQSIGGIVMVNRLVEQLKEEYPELTPGQHPED